MKRRHLRRICSSTQRSYILLSDALLPYLLLLYYKQAVLFTDHRGGERRRYDITYHFIYSYVFSTCFFFLRNFLVSLFSVRNLITFPFVLCVHLTLVINILALWYGLEQC